jgi:hypothetical protein
MLLYSLFISLAIAGPIQLSQRFPLIRDPVAADLSTQQSDACLVGARSVIQDAASLNQTIAWEIGELSSSNGETYCRTVMRMDYGKDWQYAVTEIDWKSHVTTADNTRVSVQLAFNFDRDHRVVRPRQ